MDNQKGRLDQISDRGKNSVSGAVVSSASAPLAWTWSRVPGCVPGSKQILTQFSPGTPSGAKVGRGNKLMCIRHGAPQLIPHTAPIPGTGTDEKHMV